MICFTVEEFKEQLEKDGHDVYGQCPNCGDFYEGGDYSINIGNWTPYPFDSGGSGWNAVKCEKCGCVYAEDCST